MSNIKVWNKKEKLKGLDSQVWLEAYPRAKSDTLVLVDDSEVLWLEDIKLHGFTGDTDTAVVEAFLAKREEERAKAEKEAQVQAEQKKSEIEKLKQENKSLKERIDILSETMETLVMQTLE